MKRKATGIVRRIDDLGRVVIPKEIRRVLNLKEGDAVEFYTENGTDIVLSPYSPIRTILAANKEMFQAALHGAGLNAQLYLVSPYQNWDIAIDQKTKSMVDPILKHLREDDTPPSKFIKKDDDKENIHLTIIPLYQPDMTYIGSIVMSHAPGDDPVQTEAYLNMIRSICVWELEKGT